MSETLNEKTEKKVAKKVGYVVLAPLLVGAVKTYAELWRGETFTADQARSAGVAALTQLEHALELPVPLVVVAIPLSSFQGYEPIVKQVAPKIEMKKVDL